MIIIPDCVFCVHGQGEKEKFKHCKHFKEMPSIVWKGEKKCPKFKETKDLTK